MKLLDLFCCEGGMAKGYANVGFDVTGMDIVSQRRYPFEFYKDDALDALSKMIVLDKGSAWGFSVIHASPPCQADSITKHSHSKQHVSLVAPTRELLRWTRLPYVMENVVGAKMPGSIIVCGAALDLIAEDEDGSALVLKRHRQVEFTSINAALVVSALSTSGVATRSVGCTGGGSSDRHHAENVRHGGYTPSKSVQERLMGIDWMTQHGLNQAMPPAYGEFIGKQVMEYLAYYRTNTTKDPNE
jgi:DNA (cytosine-5)-methyltransferase 1